MCPNFRATFAPIITDQVVVAPPHSTPDVSSTTESFAPGPLIDHQSPAPARLCDCPSLFATIYSRNVPTFTTEKSVSPWLSKSPLSPRPSPTTAPDLLYLPTTDFELFPCRPVNHPIARSSTGPATPSPHLGPSQDPRPESHLPSAPSTSDLHSVDDLVNANNVGCPSTSPSTSNPSSARFTLVSKQNRFYASSAPASSSSLRPSPGRRVRPPVPLFHSQSTGTVHPPPPPPLQGSPFADPSMMSSSPPMASGMFSVAQHPPKRSAPSISLGTGLMVFSPSSPDLNALLDLSVADAATADDFVTDFVVHHVAEMGHRAPPAAATVSPSELWRDAPLSVPPSAALTNLTSPSNFDSPDLADSFETSPTFNGEVDPAADHWFSLFPGPAGERDESPIHPADDVLESAHFGLADALTRRRSSQLGSPQPARATPVKHSSVSGVGARKRDKPLPPIHVENVTDPVAVKRARNTLAARKSRQRKTERFEELERTIEDLRGEVVHWKNLALTRHPGRNL